MNQLKTIIFLATLTLFIGGVYFFYFYDEKEIVVLKRTTIEEEIRGEGIVAAAQEIRTGFATEGRVAEVYIQEGGAVKKDDILMRLDSAEIEHKRTQYETTIELEKLKLSQLLSGAGEKNSTFLESKIIATTALVENARKEIEDIKIQAENELAKQYALVLDYCETVILNTENAARALGEIYNEQNKFKDIFIISESQKKSEAEWQSMLEKTASENSIAGCLQIKKESAYEAIDSALSNVKTNLEVIRATLQKTSEILHEATMQFGSPDIAGYKTTVAVQRSVINAMQTEILIREQSIASQKSNAHIAIRIAEHKEIEAKNIVQTLEHELAVFRASMADTAVAVQQAQIKEHEAMLSTLKQQIQYTSLRAPIDSVVRSVRVLPGSIVSRDMITVALAPLSDAEVNMSISQDDSKKVSIGDRVDLVWEEGRDNGRVVNIHEGNIIVHFENEINIPVFDARVSAHIHVILKSNALFVPNRFIERKNNTSYVYVKRGNQTERMPIFIGIEWHDSSEILEGASEGDVLIKP